MYPKPCANCARILRPGGTSKEDYPTSELQHHAKGLCGACYRTPDRIQVEYPRPCEACDRPMRPRHATADEYPTAVIAHHAHGLCRTCYGHHYHHKKYPSPARLAEQDRLDRIRHENNVAGLQNFMARIRGKSKVRT